MDSGWRPATGIPASGERLPLLAGHPGPLTIGHLAGLVARTAGLGGALEISALGDGAGNRGQPGGRGERRCLGLWHPALADGGGGVGRMAIHHEPSPTLVPEADGCGCPGHRPLVIGSPGRFDHLQRRQSRDRGKVIISREGAWRRACRYRRGREAPPWAQADPRWMSRGS